MKTRPLGDLADLTVGHVGLMTSEYAESGVPFLRSLNIRPFRIDASDIKFISRKFHERLKKSALKPGDVVVVRTGEPGTATVIPQWLSEANCSDLVIVRPRPGLDPRYLAYLINGASRGFVNSRTVGAVQQHFNVGAARELPVPDLPLEEQRQIAGALGTLDDLIDTNRELRIRLEATRRTIVVSATRRSSIRVRLGDVAEHLPGKYLKKSDYERGGRYVVFGSNSVMGTHTHYLYEGPFSVLARIGSNCGALTLSVESAWVNNNASAIRSKSRVDNYWLHGILEQVDTDRHRGGSGQPFIRVESLMAMEVPWLEKPELARVEPALAELARAEHVLAVESQEASTTRDELMPLLLAGRVRIAKGIAG